MFRKVLLSAAELMFSVIFVGLCAYPSAFSYAWVTCGGDMAGWPVVLLMVVPIQFPFAAIVWVALAWGMALGVRPFHSAASFRALLRWSMPTAIAAAILIAAIAAALKVHEKCNFGF